MNDTGKRNLSKDSPLNFLTKRHVYDDEGNINRSYYEIAALNDLRNHFRSGLFIL